MAQPEVVPTPAKSAPSGQPVAFYLFALVLVILLPALIVSLVLLQRNNQAQEEVVRSLTNATVQAMVQTVDREVASMITTLRVLSTSRSGSLAGFHDRALVALAGTGAYLIGLDADLNQQFNTRVPFGQALGPTSDPESARKALELGVPIVSDLFFGKTAQRWVFNVLLPAPANDSDTVLLILTQDAANLTAALQSRQLPTGWHAALVDGANVVIAATPDAGVKSGQALDMLPFQQDVTSPTWQRQEINGEAMVTAERAASTAGWRVVAWAAASAVDRPFEESILWLGAWGVIIAIAAGTVAFFFAQRIASSVRGLRRDANRLGRGEPVEAKSYPVAELAEVSRALARASEQRQAAERDVRFLMRELAHRSKNQMTVISAMAKQSARGATHITSYVQSFERRIHGLARSTDLLLAHGRVGVGLNELVAHQIAPFSPGDDADRVVIEGPLIRLNAQAAQTLGMALHELSTNAVKYGAFADDSGTLSVRWTIAGDQLELVWREVCASAPAPSDSKGFGTTVIHSMVGAALGAKVERLLHCDGIEWRFVIPLAAIDPAFAAPSPDALEGDLGDD